MSDFLLRFLTRQGCHLCDQARPLVLWAADRSGGVIQELDIDADDRLTALYGLRIPVVLGPRDEVLVEGIIDDRRLLLTRMRQAQAT